MSSLNNDFNYDLGVAPTEAEIESGTMRYNYAETHGVHARVLRGYPACSSRGADGTLYHTYSNLRARYGQAERRLRLY